MTSLLLDAGPGFAVAAPHRGSALAPTDRMILRDLAVAHGLEADAVEGALVPCWILRPASTGPVSIGAASGGELVLSLNFSAAAHEEIPHPPVFPQVLHLRLGRLKGRPQARRCPAAGSPEILVLGEPEQTADFPCTDPVLPHGQSGGVRSAAWRDLMADWRCGNPPPGPGLVLFGPHDMRPDAGRRDTWRRLARVYGLPRIGAMTILFRIEHGDIVVRAA